MRLITRIALPATIALSAAACGGDDDTSGADTSGSTAAATGVSVESSANCLVRLHGKGGSGGDPTEADGITILAPTGNADGWGAKQWLYFPDDEYAAARQIVADAVVGCERVIVNGFSNGGAFAAKLYCQGETFDGRLVGVVVDDPVVDASVAGCTPDPAVGVTLYWTGALEATAQPGWECAEDDWTCEGGTTIGIDAFAEALGADVRDSPFETHDWYVDAPETMAF